MTILIKVTLALLFFLCLLDMPYGFYQLVRFIALIGFGYLAYNNIAKKNEAWAIGYLVLAILFQPMFKISLGRQIWNIVDVIVGIGLLVSIFFKEKQTTSEE